MWEFAIIYMIGINILATIILFGVFILLQIKGKKIKRMSFEIENELKYMLNDLNEINQVIYSIQKNINTITTSNIKSYDNTELLKTLSKMNPIKSRQIDKVTSKKIANEIPLLNRIKKKKDNTTYKIESDITTYEDGFTFKL